MSIDAAAWVVFGLMVVLLMGGLLAIAMSRVPVKAPPLRTLVVEREPGTMLIECHWWEVGETGDLNAYVTRDRDVRHPPPRILVASVSANDWKTAQWGKV
ncbi:hypothetical protein PE067_09300 [Paracoccus sp. DMF-8]|uniref:hypothetical protein n=1 Tax=Paracoccus sp. DMF-8 TaxID=3019445 RepID=UPI0023E77FC1|nr:hypothetical protein [Paracoccus sp. DMF-8]MDF3606314.1 hypothetical protein [Paracoccus sp. DMF-8]